MACDELNTTMAEETETKTKKETYGVLPRKLGGGPHGLGDPDDKSLRKVEKDILIMQKLRDRTKVEKCQAEVKAFHECCMENGMSLVFYCRKENAAMKACCEKWFKDEEFIQDCTKQYLEERSEYRRTGITKKQKAFANRMAASM